MNKILIIILFISGFISENSLAQSVGIGQWRTHLPYQKVIDVVETNSLIYAATPFSLFTYNPDDQRVAPFDKVNGLNDIGISKIAYSPQSQLLLLAYTDANIDIIDRDGVVTNIPDIFNKEMLGVKTINNIFFLDHFAYLSCSFGIVVLDVERQEIKDTYFIGPDGEALNVLDMAANDTAFFAATESGLYTASRQASNLADFHFWHRVNDFSNPNQTFNQITTFGNKIFANYYAGGWDGDTLYVFDGSRWQDFLPGNHARHFQLNVEDNHLFVVNRYSVKAYDDSGKEILNIYQVQDQSIEPLAVSGNMNQSLWIATKNKGLLRYTVSEGVGEFIQPGGPGSQHVFALDAAGNNVWVVPGGYQSNWSKAYMHEGVFAFTDGQWTTFDNTNTPAFDSISDMVSVKIDPANPNISFVGTWQTGILKFDQGQLTQIYTPENSSLGPWLSNTSQVNISGMDYDDQHNLWVANSGARNLLSVLKNDGNWKSFYLGNSLSGIDVASLMVDAYNQVWVRKRKNGMLIVYSYNNTVDDVSDDRVKVLNASQGNGNIPGSTVYSMATDRDGAVWVGTDKGVAVFYNPGDIFTSGVDFDAQQILVPRNDGSGLADLLLVTETVTAIAVDGANRKWIGTQRAGVFLLSSDGLEQIHHFTAENSPLLSNTITGITIDEAGEVFIGTDQGLISYRSTATAGHESNTDVYAFPNPVRPDYAGPIAIKGLVTDASVKITDSNANLVFDTRAQGGQAVWNGKNLEGKRVGAGVYLVFITNNDGSQIMVTKILIIR
jgi:hypothetical protein